MAASYAEVVVKKDNDENLEANVINHQQRIVENIQNDGEENYNATVFGQDTVNENKKLVEEVKKLAIEHDEKQRGITKRSSRETSKWSKGVIFFTVAVDIALAGALVGQLYKKPTMNRVKLGFSTVGLSLFYGFQWYVYVYIFEQFF